MKYCRWKTMTLALCAMILIAEEARAQTWRDFLNWISRAEQTASGVLHSDDFLIAACAELYSGEKVSQRICAPVKREYREEFKQYRTTITAVDGSTVREGFCEEEENRFTYGRCGALLRSGDYGQYQRLPPSEGPRSFSLPCPEVPIHADTIPDPDPYKPPEIRTETADCINGSPLQIKIEVTRTPVVFQRCRRDDPMEGCMLVSGEYDSWEAYRLVTPGEWTTALEARLSCGRIQDPSLDPERWGRRTIMSCRRN